MTTEELARQAGAIHEECGDVMWRTDAINEWMPRLLALVRAQALEEAALECDREMSSLQEHHDERWTAAQDCADRVRALK